MQFQTGTSKNCAISERQASIGTPLHAAAHSHIVENARWPRKGELDVPYWREVVSLYLVIMGQQHDSFCHRLTDKEPVERILVMRRESRNFECMLGFDRQFFVTSIKQVPAKNACIDLKVLASQRAFDDNFPDARDAEVQGVVGVFDGSARFVRQGRIVSRSPNQQMSIEQ
jgi:hypothetical protein